MKSYQISWLWVAISLIVSNLIFAAIMLWSLPHLASLANGLVMFDTRPTGYNLQQAKNIIAALGQDGQYFYLHTQLWLDAIYPASFAIAFGLLIAKFSQILHYRTGLIITLLLAPLLTAIFDYTENYYIADMLQNAEYITAKMVEAANFATISKSVVSSITQLTAFILLVTTLFKRFRKQTHENN
ncbi:MAG: hypothetical protein HRU29_07370 [Rhizobiales bacterium]|nr:hypothetical protein [Hyphomicrobiales bacterium]NRB14206.1 hypothetical protein [Hyphomicrobiales bacterium]